MLVWFTGNELNDVIDIDIATNNPPSRRTIHNGLLLSTENSALTVMTAQVTYTRGRTASFTWITVPLPHQGIPPSHAGTAPPYTSTYGILYAFKTVTHSRVSATTLQQPRCIHRQLIQREDHIDLPGDDPWTLVPT